MGDGKRERAAARLDIATLPKTPKTKQVQAWLKRKALKDLGIMAMEGQMYVDEIEDMLAVSSMWSETQRRKK